MEACLFMQRIKMDYDMESAGRLVRQCKMMVALARRSTDGDGNLEALLQSIDAY